MLAAGLLAATPVFAGSFTTDFAPGSTGYTLVGAGTDPGGYITNYVGNPVPYRAVLAPAVAPSPDLANEGSVTIADFDGGQPIESCVANFQLQLGPGSPDAADGVSFNFGPDIYDGEIGNEEGTGPTALTVSFDIYDNGVADEYGAPSTPAVDIEFGGVVIASHAYDKADMVTSQLEDVSIQLTRAGKVSVVYKGEIIHTNVFIPGWAPTKGLFNLSARSGGEFCEQEVANLSINTVLQGAAVAPTILTNPASATVNERGSTNFTVTVDGTAPFSFQWTDNGADIPGATGATLTMGPIPYTENGHLIRVRVTNPANPTTGVTSGAATLTVIRDTTPPTVLKANADVSGAMVTVVYSEPVNDTAQNSSNYGIDQGVTINSVSRLDASRVVLNLLTPMPRGLSYTLSIHGVQDTASSPPNTIAPTEVHFRTYVFQVGAATHKMYSGFNDNQYTLDDLQGDPRFPNNPDRQDVMTRFEYPADGNNINPADPIQDYSDTLECYFIPPTTNDYVFYIAGSDTIDLYMSPDADPANMVSIASVWDWTVPRGWMEPLSDPGNTNGFRSDSYTGNLWPGAGDPATGSAFIHLDGGLQYYLFADHHCFSWSGEGQFAATYTYAGAPAPAVGDAPLLTGSVIGTYLDLTGTIPTLTIKVNSDGTFTLTYTGTLYSSPTVTGIYNPVSGASNPWTVNPKATSAPATQYYRAGP